MYWFVKKWWKEKKKKDDKKISKLKSQIKIKNEKIKKLQNFNLKYIKLYHKKTQIDNIINYYNRYINSTIINNCNNNIKDIFELNNHKNNLKTYLN